MSEDNSNADSYYGDSEANEEELDLSFLDDDKPSADK